MSQPYNLSQLADNVNSSGVLQPSGGGTGTTSTTGSGAAVLATSPTLVTPALGTPSAVNLTNATNVPVNQATGTLAVGNGGTSSTTFTSNAVLLGNGGSAFQSVSPSTSGNILTSNGTTWLSSAPAPGMVYPSSGIANSTGSAWGTSYAVTGSGNVVLGTSPTISSPGITGGTINNTPIGGTTATTGAFTTATIATATITSGTVANAPVNGTDITNKTYVDAATAALNTHTAVQAATTVSGGNLTSTYSNGSSGVGATLTNSGTQAAFAVDGYTATAADRILVKNQTTQSQNGVYVVTTVGTVSTNWVLTRASDYDQSIPGEIAAGDYLFVQNGTINAGTGWVQTTPAPIVVGTTAIVFTQFSGTGTYTAGTGLALTGTQFSNTGVLSVTTSSGLSANTAATGAVSITNTSPMVYPGSGIPNSTSTAWGSSYTTSGTGTVLALNTSPSFTTPTLGVATATSINKVSFTTPATSSTLTVADGKTLTASNTITFTATDGSTLAIGGGGTLGTAAYTASTAYAPAAGSSSITTLGTIATGTWNATAIGPTYGGTNQTTYTTGDILYASAANTLSKLGIGSTGNVLTVSGGAPAWSAPTGGVTTFSAGTTGFTPSTATSGAIVLAGTLAIANGGTASTTAAGALTALGAYAATNPSGFITSSGSITGSSATFTSTTQNSQFNSIGVGTAGSGTAGEIRATNNITAYYSSDAKFKENIRPIENALDKIKVIGGKEFEWTDEYIDAHGGEDGYFIAKEDFGLVAQDVQKVFPKAVKTRPDGSLAVDYTKLGVLAFQGIVELLKRIEALEAK